MFDGCVSNLSFCKCTDLTELVLRAMKTEKNMTYICSEYVSHIRNVYLLFCSHVVRVIRFFQCHTTTFFLTFVIEGWFVVSVSHMFLFWVSE